MKTTIIITAGSDDSWNSCSPVQEPEQQKSDPSLYGTFSTAGEETLRIMIWKEIAEQIRPIVKKHGWKGQTKDNALNAYIAARLSIRIFISGESKLYDAGHRFHWRILGELSQYKNYLTEEQWGPVSAGRRTYLLDSTIRSFTGAGHGSNPQRRSFLDSDREFWNGQTIRKITTGGWIFWSSEQYQEANPCLKNGTQYSVYYAMTGDTFVWECSSISGWISVRSTTSSDQILWVIDYILTKILIIKWRIQKKEWSAPGNIGYLWRISG